MKNPNGFGTVVKLSGNRRKPYAVRKTIGFNEKGYPIYKAIGYTATKAEGLIMLAEYNKNPYDLDIRNITVQEVYERWLKRDSEKMTKAAISAAKSAWKHCAAVAKIRYIELKAYQMQECIDNCPHGYSTKGSIKSLFGHLDKYALELDIIVKSNAALITAPPIPDTEKKPFSEEEIKKIWKHKDEECIGTLLCLLYMGWRISELLSIRTENVDLEACTIIAGTKTKNGKNRIVPIHKRVLPFIEAYYNKDNVYLFECNGKPWNISAYRERWRVMMQTLGMKHTPHECRHTFRSRLDSAGANKVCIDLLMGHKSKEVGERVYTHKTIEELRKTINLLD